MEFFCSQFFDLAYAIKRFASQTWNTVTWFQDVQPFPILRAKTVSFKHLECSRLNVRCQRVISLMFVCIQLCEFLAVLPF